MGSNPHANGGELLVPLSMPHFHEYAAVLPKPGSVEAESTRILGKFLRDVMKLNLEKRTSGCLALTRRRRTGWTLSTKLLARSG
jgi:phosphoketolase